MANKTFETYFDERIELTGNPPPEGDFYLVERSGVVYKTTFGGTVGLAAGVDDSDVTTIAGVNTWTAPANTLVLEAATPTLVFADNTFTYAGFSQSVPTPITASTSLKKTQSASMVYKLGISINGTVVRAHTGVSVIDTEESFVSTRWVAALNPGDTIEMVIENISGDHDIILIDPQLSIG